MISEKGIYIYQLKFHDQSQKHVDTCVFFSCLLIIYLYIIPFSLFHFSYSTTENIGRG